MGWHYRILHCSNTTGMITVPLLQRGFHFSVESYFTFVSDDKLSMTIYLLLNGNFIIVHNNNNHKGN